MSSSRRHSMRPVIVEVRPDNAPASNIAPSSPASTKAVRFAPKSEDRASRPLTSTEAWSLYHFENHARHCPACYYPLEVSQLCASGHGLAQDVAYHVYHLNGEVYGTGNSLVHVEVPRGYTQLRSLLRAQATHRQRSQSRTAPASGSYSARKSWTPEFESDNAILESAAPSRRRPRYASVVVDKDMANVSAMTSKPSTASRGTLYQQELKRTPRDYRVEAWGPSDPRKERRRHSGVFF